MAIKNRTDLKAYFVKNAIPTEGNFADLIDSQLNQAQDGVFKPDGEALSVVAASGDQKRVLRLYASYPQANPDWMITLRPAQDPANAAGTSRAGFGVTDSSGKTRLFVDATTGQIGVGTNNPQLALDVVGGAQANGFRGRYDLVLNDYRTVNPASNVCLQSPPGDRDAWIYRDTADATRNWGIYHRQIDAPVAGLPANSIAFVGGDSSKLQAYVNLGDGSAFFAGKVNAAGYAQAGGAVNAGTMEIGGPNPIANGSGGGVLYLHHHGVVAHQLRYNSGTLFFEAAGNGYGTNPRPTLALGGDVSIEGKHAFRGNDTFLRLNQDLQFTAGVHTPGNFAPNALNVGGVNGWGNPGAGNAWMAGTLTVKGAIVPSVGNSENNGIQFPGDPGQGGGDRAFIRYYVESGETTKLLIGNNNDADDRISLYQMSGERLTAYNGCIGINNITPGAALDVSATSTTWGGWLEAIRFSRPEHSAITHPGGKLQFGMHGDRNFYFSDTNVGRHVMTISGASGNVGILGDITVGATISTAGRMHLSGGELCYMLHKNGVIIGKEWGGNGNLSVEGSKNFHINHPLDPKRFLVHSVVEGPEAAVFYRGEAVLVDGTCEVKLPPYFEALTRKDNRTVLVTPKLSGDEEISALAASGVTDGRFLVRGIDGRNRKQRFYWEVKGVRADIDPIEVEPLKTDFPAAPQAQVLQASPGPAKMT
jgi:hypothetical protein